MCCFSQEYFDTPGLECALTHEIGLTGTIEINWYPAAML